MKILHISDLHIGKKISGYSLLEDQKYFLDNTIKFMKDKGISHLIVAGDIYDVSLPSGEAISIFNDFLNQLSNEGIKAFIISGNHDSKDRVGYGSKLIAKSNIYINSDIKEAIKPICVDGINYYLIPYASASEINTVFNQSFKTYDEAFAYVISLMNIDKSKINIAVSHQLVLGKNQILLGGSEEPIIGTIQNINALVFKDFTYTALGHIHRPQNISDRIRYSGSPLPYHIDETKYKKNYIILDITKDNLSISLEEIVPKRRTVELKGSFDDIINNHKDEVNSYVYATITEGSRVDNAMAILKNTYPYAISIRYLMNEVEGVDITKKISDIENKNPFDLFSEFYSKQTGNELNSYQIDIVNQLLKEEE